MVVWVKVMPRSAIKGAELEGEIPSYAEHDDFLVKVPALEELLCRGGFRHRWPLTPQSQLFKFAPEPYFSPEMLLCKCRPFVSARFLVPNPILCAAFLFVKDPYRRPFMLKTFACSI